MGQDVLRIVDANLNRIAEGLRVLEDIARLSLNDPDLSRTIKDMRHDLREVEAPLQERLIAARDAAQDVGRDITTPDQENSRELAGMVMANARRVQEALRVLEEMARLPGITLNAVKFKRARFELYSLEKAILSRMAGMSPP